MSMELLRLVVKQTGYVIASPQFSVRLHLERGRSSCPGEGRGGGIQGIGGGGGGTQGVRGDHRQPTSELCGLVGTAGGGRRAEISPPSK